MAEQKPQCQSQQRRGKTCRTDTCLKNHRALWCEKCKTDQAAEDAMGGLYGMGYIV